MLLRPIGKLRAPFVTCGKVSPLNDEAGNDARKSRRLERTCSSEVKKAARCLGGFRRQHLDGDSSLFCFERDALAGHLFYRGAVERLCFRLSRVCRPSIGFLERL